MRIKIRDLGLYFKISLKTLFGQENIEKLISKIAYLWQFGGFFSAALTAQNSPEVL